MYKLLGEHSNDKRSIDSTSVGSPHLLFLQGAQGNQLRCLKCGLINYTVYTCVNCNDRTRFVKDKPNKQAVFQKGSLKRRETKHLHKLIKGKEVRARRSKPEGLGFVQVAESKKLTVEEINNSIDDEPKKTPVAILESETITIEV